MEVREQSVLSFHRVDTGIELRSAGLSFNILYASKELELLAEVSSSTPM